MSVCINSQPLIDAWYLMLDTSTSTVHPCGDDGPDLWPLLHTFGWILIVLIRSFFLATFLFNLVNSCKSTGSPIWASNSFTVVGGVLKVSSPLSAQLYFMYESQKRGSVLTETVHLKNALLFLQISDLFSFLVHWGRKKEMWWERKSSVILLLFPVSTAWGLQREELQEPRGVERSRKEPRGATRSCEELRGATRSH